MTRAGLGIVGLNNQGMEHLLACRDSQHWHLAALCDQDEEILARALSDADPETLGYTDLTAMLRNPRVDAVVIALPHALHSWAVALCASAGKHILKEKPLGRSMSESHAILDLANEGGVVLYTGVQRRHHGTYEALQQWLQTEPAPHSVALAMTVVPRADSDADGVSWRNNAHSSGGGAFIDLGYHAVDLLHFLLGPIEAISCVTFRDGRPCNIHVAEDSARVWARTGSTWIRMETGRSHSKTESLVLQWPDGRSIAADRERVTLNEGGHDTLLFEADRAWTRTMVDQLDDFHARIAGAAQGLADSHEEQGAVQRFIERCYAMQRIDGLAGAK
jgi:predicted dehydrogenase